MKEKSSTKKIVIGAAALVIVCAALLLIYRNFMPKGMEGEKTITVKVVHGDGSAIDRKDSISLRKVGLLLLWQC